MRLRLKSLWMLVLVAGVLTACAADPAAVTEEAAQPSTPTLEPTRPVIVVTRPPVTLTPLPGEVPDEELIDPDIDLVFDRLQLVRTGRGDEIPPIQIVLNQDGTYTRDGVPGTISPEEVAAIDALLDEISFFTMDASMLPAGPPDGVSFRYALTVSRAGAERSVQSQDGFMPQPYLDLLTRLFEIGQPQA